MKPAQREAIKRAQAAKKAGGGKTAAKNAVPQPWLRSREWAADVHHFGRRHSTPGIRTLRFSQRNDLVR
jgi:hypothetical protein